LSARRCGAALCRTVREGREAAQYRFADFSDAVAGVTLDQVTAS